MNKSARLFYDIGMVTHAGLVRGRNEDGYHVDRERLWIVVCDGLGGLPCGDVASREAARFLGERARQWNLEEPSEALAALMTESLKMAHGHLIEMADRNPQSTGMGTTVVCALLRSDCILHLYAGDSRLYWFTGPKLRYHTKDHSQGFNRLTSCLGGLPDRLSLEISPLGGARLDVAPGDTIIMCTDGLYACVSDEEITRFVQRPSTAQALAERLAGAALDAGGEDNVTVAAVRVKDAPVTYNPEDLFMQFIAASMKAISSINRRSSGSL